MQLLLDKLLRHWQLRFVVVGAGILLIAYAVLLPDPSNKSQDTSILSVAAAPRASAMGTQSSEKTIPVGVDGAGSASAATPASLQSPWLGGNLAVADQLSIAAEAYQDEGLPRDFSQSIRDLRIAANRDNPVAQFLLGHAYQVGLGVPKDMTETARWYGRAVAVRASDGTSAGSTPAPKDFAEAFDSYRKSAEQGDAGAELYMGLAYDLGEDVPRSSVAAARWYRMAAAQGSSSAACNLGVLYRDGDGMPKDGAEAAIWFSSAAAQGSANAQYSLGRMYYEGDGIPQNYSKAAPLLKKAAQQGSAPAEVLLSVMYATGQGVPGSTPMAYMWINLASGSENQARISREQIEKVISPDEIAEGQRLTHDWLAQHSRSMR